MAGEAPWLIGSAAQPPSLLDAVLPVVVPIVPIAITIWLFGQAEERWPSLRLFVAQSGFFVTSGS